MQTYRIQHLDDFHPYLHHMDGNHDDRIREYDIALTPNQLLGLIVGFAMTEHYIDDINKCIRIINPDGDFVDPADAIKNSPSAQFAGQVTGFTPYTEYDLIEHIWKTHRGKPKTKYHLLITLETLPFRYLAWGFDNLEFLQGILTACNWVRRDCKYILQLYDQNGNPLDH